MVMKMIGIYQIKNIINDKRYIGQTVNEKRRKANHLFLLRRNQHHSTKLQNAYNKYGEENFVFEMLEECEVEKLNEKELLYIQKYDSFNNGYNCNEGGQFRVDYSGSNNPMYGKKGILSPRFKDYILQLTLDDKIIGRFDNCRSAAAAVNGDYSTIHKCLIHERKKHKGFKWVYEKEYLNDDIV